MGCARLELSLPCDEPQMFASVAMDGDNDGDDEAQLLFFRLEKKF